MSGHDPLLPPTVVVDWSLDEIPELLDPLELVELLELLELLELVESSVDVVVVDVVLSVDVVPVVAAAECPTADTSVTVSASPAAPTPPAARAARWNKRLVRGCVVMGTTVAPCGSAPHHHMVKLVLSRLMSPLGPRRSRVTRSLRANSALSVALLGIVRWTGTAKIH
jgi:hypothetical protein